MTTTGITRWTVQPVPVPSSLDDDDAWALHGEAALEATVHRATWGHADLAFPAPAVLAHLRARDSVERTHLVVTHPDRPRDVVGAAHLVAPQRGNTHLVEGELLVHPDHRRQGIGTALLEAAERHTRAVGRRLLIIGSDHGTEPAADDPDAITPPSGSGRISRRDPFARFAERHGLRLDQSDRYSVLPLPVDTGHLERLRAEAEVVAGPDYRLITWQDRCPDEWVDQFAVLETRMTTDSPMGALEIEEDPWDADRVREAEATSAASGLASLGTAAVHVATGTLAGFTELEYPIEQPEVVFQEDTLVLREHRGHRLGQLVKAVNLQRLAEVRPGARRVHTWNAEENSYMLRINVALGFRPVGVCGSWTTAVD
ncbi:GNAT family N-acetyltransferase [Cellulomonas sp. ATA003]|uniref:GNAT family N-acetyltransferase n=1 Tax=Cellulomonas sp. ATA003 TaxID=3073064 RepID=UPI002872EC22|nr:GNAT family N-acetyltransferase [Cellulomonas sp. ATA003]WNB85750.1 GNAT family N-acetyltransferase [Cellulomonas sp. ATA003]